MRFNNRFYFLFFGTIALFLFAYSQEKYFDADRLLNEYVNYVQADLQKHEQDIQLQLQDTTFFSNRYTHTSTDLLSVKSLSGKHFNICLYDQDSLFFWSNSIAFPDPTTLKQIHDADGPILKQLSNGFFVFEKHSLPSLPDHRFVISVIPIKWSYAETLAHLGSHFEAKPAYKIPKEVLVSKEKSDYPIISSKEKTLFYLNAEKPFADTGVLNRLLFFYLLGFIFLGIVINKIAKELTRNTRPWIGPTFLLVSVFGIRYLSLDWSLKFEKFQVFSRSFENPNVSVGDLMINIILLLWVVIFIHRESKDKDFSVNFSPGTRFFLVTMNYLSVILALLLLISVLKSLVLTSGIAFDFKNVFSLDHYSVIAVMGVILLLFTQFIFSHRMMITINKLNLARPKRLGSLCLAIFIALPIIHFINLEIPMYFSALLSFIFIVSYDLFMDIRNPGVGWLVGWVILFSAVSCGLLYTYNLEKEIKNEIKIAKLLAEEDDAFAENAILKFKEELEQTIEKITLNTDPSAIANLVDGLYFKQNYLYSNYTYKLNSYDQTGASFSPISNSSTLTEWQEKFAQSKKVIGQDHIYFHTDESSPSSYILSHSLPNASDSENTIILFFEFKKANRKRPKVYTNLLSGQKFKQLENLGNYDYAIIKNGAAISEEGISADAPNFSPEEEPPIGGYAKKSNDDEIYFLYRSGEKDYIILSKPKNNLFHPVSLFSFLFGFLTIMVLLAALINSKLSILPDSFNFHFWNKPSLKNRIQFSTIFLTLVSFIIIGFVSVYFLRDSYISYDKSRLNRKVSNVQTSAEQYLTDGSLDKLKSNVSRLAKAQRIDVNLFNLKGELIQSSDIDIFKRGILPPKMNAFAFETFDKDAKANFVQVEESISEEHFISAFVPVNNVNGEKLAYLGIPYSNHQRTLQSDVSNFMGNLLNVYVFLLLITGAVSVYVASSITKPITTIGENLKELKLGNPNEPLEWGTNDEIGALITEYNRMILKLEHSAKLLARSEREGAWREMAKQVAHEIKNPLTPMKLSIQYLLHAYRSKPDDIEPLMKRVSNTLIEQIDSLAQIADEFSNFAQMPRANNQQILLNHLVESVYDLFKESKGSEVTLKLPEDDFYVFADKNHVVRVLNNMIKNAVEAIPDSRGGKIEVSLYKDNTTAVIKVEDNGVGIPDEMKEKVFVPNFTTKNSGTGLGLAISKNIIESVNGKIYFETETNVGTQFYVELPLEDMLI